jgi:hypothetical protein
MNTKSWMSALRLAFTVAACSETDKASLELSGLNYTNAWITTFSVNEYGGHGISPNGVAEPSYVASPSHENGMPA